ncbi:hypothetical protein BGZ94_004839 [Podila epigama]|nr:hypothetical protein BGZ94_004839 [Podila epigama]
MSDHYMSTFNLTPLSETRPFSQQPRRAIPTRPGRTSPKPSRKQSQEQDVDENEDRQYPERHQSTQAIKGTGGINFNDDQRQRYPWEITHLSNESIQEERQKIKTMAAEVSNQRQEVIRAQRQLQDFQASIDELSNMITQQHQHPQKTQEFVHDDENDSPPMYTPRR